MENCPCCSGKSYDRCCEPVISNVSANTALALMRSRYTAYYKAQAEYLFNTTHLKTRVESSVSEIKKWAKENKWIKLEIICTEKGLHHDNEGFVEFKAHFIDKNGRNQIHHEKSTFLKENGKWYYLEGMANPESENSNKKVSRNDPCPCGSGRKYKKCCATK